MRHLVLPFAMLMTACAVHPDYARTSPPHIIKMSQDELKLVSSDQLCNAAYWASQFPVMPDTASVQREIYSRDLISDRDYELVSKRETDAGMSSCAYVALVGLPNPNRGSVTTSQRADGTTIKVYTTISPDYHGFVKAYFVNDKLTEVVSNIH